MYEPTDRIVARLTQEMASWNSMEIRVRQEQERSGPLPPGASSKTRMVTHYIVTSAGQRLKEQSFFALPSEKETRSYAYCGGKRCAQLRCGDQSEGFKQKSVFVGRSFGTESQSGYSDAPLPLQFAYFVGLEPLYEAIPRAKLLRTDSVLGRECDVFLFTEVSGFPQDLVYYLDRTTAFPLKVEAYQAGKTSRDSLNWYWAASSLDEVDLHHIPLKSEEVIVSHDPQTGQETVSVRSTISIEEVKFNKVYASSLFWPKFETGAQVVDNVAEKVYTEGGARPSEPQPTAKTAAVPPQPIQATPPTDGTGSLAGIMLSLGLVILLVSFILWRRR